MKLKIALLAGDGIGPEVMAEAEKVLQVVAVGLHRRLQARRGVVLGVVAEVVGLPVHDPETAVVLEHQVDEALEHPLHGGKTERLAAPRQGVVLLAECGQRRCRHPPHGQEELQLHRDDGGQPALGVAGHDIGQRMARIT